MAHQDQPESLSDVLDQLRQTAEEQDDGVTVQEALDAFEGRLFGPLLLIPGLIIVTPLGAIPTLPTLMGTVIVLVAAQSLFGRTNPWLPSFIAERSVNEDRFIRAIDRFRPWARRIDRITRPRLRFLITGKMKYVVAAICVALAVTLPPLELLPWAAAAPGLAISLLGLAITVEDGVLGLLGMIASVATLGLAIWTIV